MSNEQKNDLYYFTLDNRPDTYFGGFKTKIEAKIFKACITNQSPDLIAGFSLILEEEKHDLISYENKKFINHTRMRNCFINGYTTKQILDIVHRWTHGESTIYTKQYNEELEDNYPSQYRKWKYS